MLKIIAAVDQAYGLGKNGGLPWSFVEDMSYFKSHTKDKICLFGPRTYDSLPEAAKKRIGKQAYVWDKYACGAYYYDPTKPYIVASNDMIHDLVFHARAHDIMVCGGAGFYNLILGCYPVEEILLTKIHATYNCDVFFPKQYMHWYLKTKSTTTNCVDRVSGATISVNFETYVRKDLAVS